MSLNFEDCKVYISSVDSQGSAEGGIVVQVIGEMSNRARPWRKFAQTFFLAQQPNGYFVLNDICRYIKEEGDEEEVAAESASSVVTGEVNTIIPDTSFDYIPQEEYTSNGVPTSTTTDTTEELIIITETTPSSPLSLPSQPTLNEVNQPEIPTSPDITSSPSVAISDVTETVPISTPEVLLKEEVTPEEIAQEVASIIEPTPSAKEVSPPVLSSAAAVSSSPKASKQSAKSPKSPKSTSTPAVIPTTPSVVPTLVQAVAPTDPKVPIATPTAPLPTPVIAAKPAVKTWASLAATAPKPKAVAPPVASTSTPSSNTPNSTPSAATSTPATASKYHPSVMAVTNHGCFVKGVIETVSEKALKDALVEKFGALKEFDVIRSRACAFIEFEKLDGARKAIQASMRIGDGGEGGLFIVSEVGGTPDLLHVVTRKAVGDRPVSNGRRGGGAVGGNAGDERSARGGGGGGGGGQRNGSGSGSGASRGGAGGAAGAVANNAEEGAKATKGTSSSKGGKGGAKTPKPKVV